MYIEKKLLFNLFGLFRVYYRYTVYYRENFDVNAPKMILYYTDVSSYMLPLIIEELCDKYYSKLTALSSGVKEVEAVPEPSREPLDIYQCRHCKSIYDKAFGEPNMQIPLGTPFAQLPADFRCTLCEAPKEDFVRVDDFVIAQV